MRYAADVQSSPAPCGTADEPAMNAGWLKKFHPVAVELSTDARLQYRQPCTTNEPLRCARDPFMSAKVLSAI